MIIEIGWRKKKDAAYVVLVEKFKERHPNFTRKLMIQRKISILKKSRKKFLETYRLFFTFLKIIEFLFSLEDILFEEDICSSMLALSQERTDFLRKNIDRVWPTEYCQYIAQIKFAQNDWSCMGRFIIQSAGTA